MRKSLLILTLCYFIFSSFETHGQSWVWAQRAGGSSYEEGNSVTTDVFGNIYLAGRFSSPTITFGAVTLINSGSYDIFLVKYDASGNVLWAKNVGQTDHHAGPCVTTDIAGNVLVAGFFTSASITFGTTSFTNNGEADVFLVKYDSSGNVLWAKTAGGNLSDACNSITTDATGNIYIAGWFVSLSINFGTTTLTHFSSYANMFVVKYDSAGNVIWAKNSGEYDQSSSAGSVSADSWGNVYVAGEFSSSTITFGSTVLTNTSGCCSGKNDIFLVKYNSTGNVIWAKSAGGAQWDRLGSAVADASGNIYLAGSFMSDTIYFGNAFLINTVYDTSTLDIFLVKYDSAGNVMWARSNGGHFSDIVTSLTSDALGDVYIAGSFESTTISFGTNTLTSAVSNMFLAKYNSSGNIEYAINPAGYITSPFSVACDASGFVYVTGYFNCDTLTFGATDLINDTTVGTTDMFVAKLASTTGTPMIASVRNNIDILPNPAINKLTITSLTRITSVAISNMLGQVVYSNKYNSEKVDVSVADWPSGMYIVKVNGSEVQKFIKQ